MDPLSLAVSGLVIAAAFAYTLRPLFKAQDASGWVMETGGESPVARLLLEREQAYKNIMDIEFDREMGKLSEEDYGEMIAASRARALDVLRRLEAYGVGEGAAPAHVNEQEAEEVAGQVESSSPFAPAEAPQDGLDRRLEAEILRHRAVPPPPAAPSAPAQAHASAVAKFCPSCGQPAGEAHNFCAACGSKLS